MSQAKWVAIQRTSRNQYVGTSARSTSNSGGRDAAINFKMHSVAKTARCDHVAHFTNLWLHGGDVTLTTKPRVHCHHKNHVHKIEHVFNGACWCVWVQRNGC